MIESKHRSMRATRSLRNFLLIVAVVGCAFIVADQPVVETVDAFVILGILTGIAIGAVVGYLLARNEASSTYTGYDEALALGFDQFSSDLMIKWNLYTNQSYTTTDNMAGVLDTQYLFFARGAQNKVGSFLDHTTFDDEVKYNVTIEAQNTIAGYMTAEMLLLENVYSEMIAQDMAMELDPSNTHNVKFIENSIGTPLATDTANYTIRYGYPLTQGTSGNLTWFTPKIILHQNTEVWIKNHTTGESSVYNNTGTPANPYKEIFFPSDEYAKQIQLKSGKIFLYGIRGDFNIDSLGAWMIRNGNFDFRFGDNGVSDFIRDEKEAVPFTGKYFPQDADIHFENYTNNASNVYGSAVGSASLLFDQYKAFGYSSAEDIPADQAVIFPTTLFYDVNQMSEMNMTELALMWFSFLSWVNNSDIAPDQVVIDATQANFTNAQLVLRANITKWKTEYNETGIVLSSVPTNVFERRPILIVPLEESIVFNVSDKKNLTQNVLIMDAETQEFLNLNVFKGVRESVNVTDWEIEVFGITDHGVEVDNGSIDRTSVAEWVNAEYEDNPLFLFSQPSMSQATSYLIIAGVVAGAGVGVMVLASSRPSFAGFGSIGRLMLYGGILGAVAIAIWYWVIPYLQDLWSGFTGWLPF